MDQVPFVNTLNRRDLETYGDARFRQVTYVNGTGKGRSRNADNEGGTHHLPGSHADGLDVEIFTAHAE